jgi:hypothetical protein
LARDDKDEQMVVTTSMAYVLRDARGLCGFKLTLAGERSVAGAEKFPTAE